MSALGFFLTNDTYGTKKDDFYSDLSNIPWLKDKYRVGDKNIHSSLRPLPIVFLNLSQLLKLSLSSLVSTTISKFEKFLKFNVQLELELWAYNHGVIIS